jgi:hypothetical protein
MNTKAILLRRISKMGSQDVAELAAMVKERARPVLKLRGLSELISRGHDLRCAPFNPDGFLMDGRVLGVSVLESPDLAERWWHTSPRQS